MGCIESGAGAGRGRIVRCDRRNRWSCIRGPPAFFTSIPPLIARIIKGWLDDLGSCLDEFAAQSGHDGPGLVVQLLLPPVGHGRLLRRYRELADRARLA